MYVNDGHQLIWMLIPSIEVDDEFLNWMNEDHQLSEWLRLDGSECVSRIGFVSICKQIGGGVYISVSNFSGTLVPVMSFQ